MTTLHLNFVLISSILANLTYSYSLTYFCTCFFTIICRWFPHLRVWSWIAEKVRPHTEYSWHCTSTYIQCECWNECSPNLRGVQHTATSSQLSRESELRATPSLWQPYRQRSKTLGGTRARARTGMSWLSLDTSRVWQLDRQRSQILHGLRHNHNHKIPRLTEQKEVSWDET